MANVFGHRKAKRGNDIACIFVHAGAGYHSIQNEHVHLQACTDAAKAGIQIMRNGGSACDAVEIAIKILEDREITNAGYGSNLAMDGVVECDAVIVDQHGRSGGCGAVAQIKNPISLARLILDHSTTQLSLRRVPPNLLVGQGAIDFAASFNMPVFPHDALISPAARDRWTKWRQDLRNAEARARQSYPLLYDAVPFSQPNDNLHEEDRFREQMRQAHTHALETGVWNEAQPMSPLPSSEAISLAGSSSPIDTRRSTPSVMAASSTHTTPDMYMEAPARPYTSTDPFGPPGFFPSRGSFVQSSDPQHGGRHGAQTINDGHSPDPFALDIEMRDVASRVPPSDLDKSRHSPWADGSSSDENSASSASTLQLPSLTPSPEPQQHPQQGLPASFSTSSAAINTHLPDTPADKERDNPSPAHTTPLDHLHAKQNPPLPPLPAKPHGVEGGDRNDHITDTVGCIAIDNYGNIACGASSGGIGMKHRGRIGPAALVGVGAAVVTVDPDDRTKTCAASVTSGTGEHMTTTMAATVAAERLYHGVKKVKGGGMQPADDDDSLRSMLEVDFMGHPSVKNSNSSAAIGLLCVKKTREGAYLYFAHNTDSFALASMHANEQKPVCTMSRNQGGGAIAQGGRSVRLRASSSTSRRDKRDRAQ